jgi:DNA primase
MNIENVDFLTALKILANKAGVDLSKFQTKESSIKKTLFEIQESALTFFERKLTENKDAYEYLIKRGLTDQTIKEFHIGFAPDD